jgi:large subunit ribosomal protein L35
MPKLKNRSSVAKRIKLTKKGKLKRQKAYASHLFLNKSPQRKRNLRKKTVVASADKQRIRRMLPYK